MNLIHTSYQNNDFRILTKALDMTLNVAAGGHENRTKYEPINNLETMDLVVLLYDTKTCVGCGAYRKYDDNTAEIKRIFVRPEYRGKHHSQIILDELIHTAKSAGYERLVLETGEILAASVHLYEKSGFYVIPNYPPYENMTESLCMEKQLNKSYQCPR